MLETQYTRVNSTQFSNVQKNATLKKLSSSVEMVQMDVIHLAVIAVVPSHMMGRARLRKMKSMTTTALEVNSMLMHTIITSLYLIPKSLTFLLLQFMSCHVRHILTRPPN